ncbi:MAG TPA: hypothetical protein VLJ68_07715 [Chitinophagaceae bacterium]|nr:hypothetical protein [Chitinophagaceae bacterium]
MRKSINSLLLGVVCFMFILVSCDKNKPYTLIIAPPQVHFAYAAKVLNYYVANSASDSFQINLGTTDLSDANRTINFAITSPTGAVLGTHYTITTPGSGNTVTIPAGKAISPITIHGVFAQYPTGRKDTLVITMTSPSSGMAIAKFADTIKVVMQKYCPVSIAAFTGNYTQSRDVDGTGPYGPYTANVVSVTSLTATTASMVIANFAAAWCAPFAVQNITVTIDWTDPGNFKVTFPSQILSNTNFYGYGALTVNSAAGSTFSSCDNTFTIKSTMTVSAGSFGGVTTTMVR